MGKKRADGFFSRQNVGWNLWNMSKRVSEAKATLRRARELVDDQEATAGWSNEALAGLDRIVGRLEVCVGEAELLWDRLVETADAADPGLVEPGPVSVIHNHGDDPRTMQAVRTVWGRARPWIDEAWVLGERLKRLRATEARRGKNPTAG